MRRYFWGSRPVRAFALSLGIACLGIAVCVYLTHHAQAAVGINKQISFQGKVVAKADGTNVTNGSYSFTFRIYSSSSGDTGSPCLSTCIWEETKTLTVTSGIFQTNLGDTTALPGSVDFNSDSLYLSVKFNGDTEMSPRIRLAAVPYAFNADKLGGLSASSFAQLSPGSQQTGSLNISGDMNIGSGSSFKINGTAVCSGTTCTAASGSSFYVQNGTSTQSGNFNIQSASSGSIAAVIQGAASQSVDIFEVKDSSNNVVARVDNTGNFTATGSVGVGTIASATTKLLVQSGLANIETINSSTASSKLLTLKGAASQTGDLLQDTDTNGAVLSGINANGGIYTSGASNSFSNLTVPTISSVVATGSGGSLTNGTTYYYQMTATNAAGETVGSASTSFTATATGKSLITWSQIAGATGYKIYRNTSNSFTSGSLLLTTISNGTTVTYTDTGSATTSGLPPTTVAGTAVTIQGWNGQTNNLLQVQNSSGINLLAADVANSQINTLGLNVGGTAGLSTLGNLLNDGFENNNFAKWTLGTAGSPTISTSVVRSGQYAANFGSASNKKASITASSTVYAREYVYISSVSTSASMLWLANSSSGNSFQIYRNNSDGTVCLQNNGFGTSTGQVGSCTTTSLATGAWHEVEMRVTMSASVGQAQMWVDGTQIVSTAANQNYSSANIDSVWIGDGGGETVNMYIDDVAVGTTDPGATADILHVTGASSFGGNAQIQNSSGTTLLYADTTNMRIDLKGAQSTASLGSNLLTNGNFATNSCSFWTCGAGWAATSGAAVHTTGNTATLTQTISVVANTTYQIDFTQTGSTAGSLNFSLGANADTWQNWDSNTHRTLVAPSTGTLTFTITPTTDFNGTVDNFSVAAITGTSIAVQRILNSDATVGLEIRSGGSGTNNAYLGASSGLNNTTGAYNAGLGTGALQANTTGGYNAAVGSGALQGNTTGSWNTAVGQAALFYNTVGTSNIAIGQDALFSNVNGNTNTVIGASAGYLNVSGYGNIFIGATAGFNETGSNKLYIANSSTSTPLIGGDFSTQSLAINGSATFKPTSGNDSTTAFQIQNSTSVSLFTVDSTNKKVIIGSASSTPTLLILANKNDNINDPTGTVGAMYYNSTLGKLRCYQGSKWSNCTGTPYFPDRHWGVIAITGLNAAALSTINNTGVAGTITENKNSMTVDPQAEDNYEKYTSSTSSGGLAGWTSTYAQVQERYRPYFKTRIRTGTDLTSQRIIVRYGQTYTAGDSPAEVWAGFRYSSAAGDTTWKCGAGDGTTSSFDDTTVTVSTSHYYDLTLDWTTSGQIICTVSDNGGTPVSVTHTSNVVTSDATSLYFFNTLINLAAASRTYDVSYAYFERN